MRYAYIQTDTPRDNQRRPLNASRKSLRLIALTAALAASCTQAPSGREVHWRAADILYADSAPVPLSTADYPREEINSDTRVVLKEFKSFPRNGKTVEHGRLTVDIPEGAVIQLAYGLRPLRRKAVLPPDASATFRVALTSKQGERSLFEDTIHNGEPGAGSWKDALISLPEGNAATLIFRSDVSTGSETPLVALFAAPVMTAATRREPPRNVILVSLDTLRADHLGLYGYERPTSPNIDRLFTNEGVVVDRVYSQGTDTTGGHMAMLEGMLPTTVTKLHKARFWHSRAVVSLAELLRGGGYLTAAFTENALLDGPAGFNRGFGTYYEEKGKPPIPADASAKAPVPGQARSTGHIETTFKRGLDWLGRHRSDPFFLFLHTYQVHDPYTPPPPFQGLFPTADGAGEARRDLDNYDREIVYTDERVRRLVDEIDALGLRDNTILVVTSDHGEEFGEHGRRYHGANTTDEVLHVPLLLRAPGLLPAGVRRTGPMALMDLAPTLLDLLGLPVPEAIQGRSLAAHLRDGSPVDPIAIASEARAAFALTYDGLDRSWKRPSFAITRWPHRLVRLHTADGVSYELYDLAADPGETKNLYGEGIGGIETLKDEVDRYEPEAIAAQAALEQDIGEPREERATLPDVDDAVKEKLRALGYIK